MHPVSGNPVDFMKNGKYNYDPGLIYYVSIFIKQFLVYDMWNMF